MSDVDVAARVAAMNARRHVSSTALVEAATPAVEELLRERYPIVPFGLPPAQIQVVAVDVGELAGFIAAYMIGAVRSAIGSGE